MQQHVQQQEQDGARTRHEARQQQIYSHCKAIALDYRLSMRLEKEPAQQGGIYVYHAFLTSLDPETRLRREGCLTDLGDPDEDEPVLVDVLHCAWVLCDHLENSADLFEWVLTHPYDQIEQPEQAREQYADDQRERRQLRALLGERGYRELLGGVGDGR